MGTRATTPLIADTVDIIEAIVTITANVTMVHHNPTMAIGGYGRTGAAGDAWGTRAIKVASGGVTGTMAIEATGIKVDPEEIMIA